MWYYIPMTQTNTTTCLTCNLSDELKSDIFYWRFTEQVGAREISKRLKSRGVEIGKSALNNHFAHHVSDPSTAWEKAVPTEQPLLGVVSPSITTSKPPKGWEASFDFNEDTGVGEVTSTPQTDDKITDFSQILEQFNIDPEAFEVDGGARISKWQMWDRRLEKDGETRGGPVWLTAYKFRIRRKTRSSENIEELVNIVKDVVPHKQVPSGDYAFVFAAGDLQLGKSDADGTEGIIKRYRESLQKAVDKAKTLEGQIGPILISWVGDCIEGMVSQGGRNARRTELTTTQQVRLLRLLMTETIKAFAPLTNDLTVVSVPGNHDEAQREPVSTDPSDSWAVDALVAVSEALEFNPEAFGHVKCLVVPFDEMTTTVTVAGTTITHAHGHQWSRGKHWDWWSGQHWGDHDPGKADILLCGHLHTGVYEQQNFKHFIRTPAFEKESTYFRHRTGLVGNPSAVTFLTKDGKLKYIDFE